MSVTPVPDLEPPFTPAAPTLASPPADVGAAPPADFGAAPLPRARAIALYRKNGLLDVVAYWLRSGWSGLKAGFRLPRKVVPGASSVAQLRAENAALRREIARLKAPVRRA